MRVCVEIVAGVKKLFKNIIHMLNDAAEMFSNSAKHLFGIYMLFDIILYLCIFNNVIYMLFYILHEITLPIKKLYLST